tara:strand:- start:1157 stop:1729 length:573 start_codon:yes stop_codon:yes gene_type:complete
MKFNFVLISLSILLICFAKKTYNRVYQKSSRNNKLYLVQVSSGKIQLKSANLLASLSKKKIKLCSYIQNSSKYKNHYGMKRLLANRYVKLEELAHEYRNEAAYSVNKGERIGICLRNKKGSVENENNMMFVLLHELSHIMTKNYAHDEEFWKNFALLLRAATECNVYTYINYEKNPTTYCGHHITSVPSL